MTKIKAKMYLKHTENTPKFDLQNGEIECPSMRLASSTCSVNIKIRNPQLPKERFGDQAWLKYTVLRRQVASCGEESPHMGFRHVSAVFAAFAT